MFGDAALAGSRLIGRTPLSYVAWIALRAVEQYVTLAILLAAQLHGANPGFGAVWAVLIALPFEAVLIAAIFRAELKPPAQRFAFLRLGRVELRMAGLLVLAGLSAIIVALPASVGVAYVGFVLQRRTLAGTALVVGSVLAALALLRFAPAPAILVDEGRIDIGRAWRASRGRYMTLAVIVVAAMILDRLSGMALVSLGAPPRLHDWADLWSPVRLTGLIWRNLIGVAALAVIAGAIATVWRASKQTLS